MIGDTMLKERHVSAEKSDKTKRLYEIALKMLKNGLSDKFVVTACSYAHEYEGLFNLFLLWDSRAANVEEKKEIIADIQELLDDIVEADKGPIVKPKIEFKELDDIVVKIRVFKEKLRSLIDRHGGVTAVSKKAGIPQPSLSRLLSSGSMPRRATLYKIANALGVDESEIVSEWVR